ncbi:MAG: hypothetical protein PCFJNLEI_03656 [Verrucomicrobiae bacterium]|nr:hypothetical protein [Verrucomicrobiae bacterium]
MTMRTDTAAPAGFIALLNQAIREAGLSYRDVAEKAEISHPFLSRLLGGKRGLPSDKTIAKLERSLNVPSGKLFYEAGRPDPAAKAVLKKERAPVLMRALAPLNDDEMKQVQKLAEKLAKKYHGE